MLLGFDSDFKTDSVWWDKPEKIPDGLIIQREIEKAVNEKPFFYNDPETGKPVRLPAVKWQEFNFYYELWDDFFYLGVLPHGKGTLDERRWLIDIIKIFQKTFKQVENMVQERAARQ